MSNQGNYKDISGNVYGKWTTLARDSEKSTNKHTYWICKCECGRTKSVSLNDLQNNRSKQCISCSNSTYKGKKRGYKDISGSYWCRLKHGAKNRTIAFEIDIEYAWGIFLLQKGRCALSNKPISLTNSTASLDRIDSAKGYEPGNVQWVHKTINRLKNNYQEKEFVELCTSISKHHLRNKKEAQKITPTLAKHGVLTDGLDIIPDIKRCFGPWIIDARDGKKYLDCFGQFASQPLGWNHPGLVSKLEHFAEVCLVKVAHSDIHTKFYSEFVSRLSETMPEFTNLFFISSGALAVENAVKIAFDYKVQKLGIEHNENLINKLDIVHFENAFHGRSGYCLSLTNTDPLKTKWYPKFDWTRLSINDIGLKNLELNLKKNNTAAVIIEPILGEGGDIHVPNDFLSALRELTYKHECLLIFDEVQTGMSTGKHWCYQHSKVVPDIISFGKKYQVCGVAGTNRLNEVQGAFKTPGRINSTWGADVVDLVRGKIILDIVKEEKLLEQSTNVGNYFTERLQELNLSNVRGRGSMIAFDMNTKEDRDAFHAKLCRNMLCLKSGQKGIRFRPHLTFTKNDVDTAIDIIKKEL